MSNLSCEVVFKIMVCVISYLLVPNNAYSTERFPDIYEKVINNEASAVLAWLSEGNDANTTYQGMPLIVASVSERCNLEVLKLLIKSGADINASDDVLKATNLHYSAQHKDLSCLKLILSSGAKIDALDINGKTAYFYALDFNNSAAITLLNESGLSVFIKDNDGIDVIHMSVLMDRAIIFKDLLINVLTGQKINNENINE